ncbi:N-acetylmuramic acid 6-phosphate etherase [Mycoplasmopsis edwardii]|uniref:N-acetylmuramic acid 6-phosphate etherase n=1 Tax=Mycoplasmopsis edwardii TaxID=53558 RepID=A0ACD4PIC0_9BACT|nr:N-acetylmuramic acid 6-phosphate etherase [Mycoplasmopsis edwardii]WBP84291.1 N-acetylmuramic acid 6-phosphate etherase [Mycoplasmopsis edwardii]
MKELDKLSIKNLVNLFNETNLEVHQALKNIEGDLELIIQKIIKTIQNRGRVIYVGAGSSGRIGLLDALDVLPTFNEENWFTYSMAGGNQAVLKSLEGFEDDYQLGFNDAKRMNVNQKDLIVGLSASGNTKYIKGFFDFGKSQNAYNVLIENKRGGACEGVSDFILFVDTGKEIIDGSTRLKAATAQKLILNMFSSIGAIKNNKVYNDLMIDLTPINEKLVLRSYQIISLINNVSLEKAKEYYELADHNIKQACVMLKYNINKESAKNLLDKSNNNLRKALENGINN